MNDMMIAVHLHTMSCFPAKLRGGGGVVAGMGVGVGVGLCLFEGDTMFEYRYVDIVCILVQEKN